MGLLDGLVDPEISKQFQPSEEDKRNALNNSLMMAGLAMMGSRGRFGEAIANGGMAGLGAYQQSLDQGRRGKLEQLNLGMSVQGMLEKQRQKKAQEEALRNMLPEDQQAVAMGVPVADIYKNRNQAYNLGQGEKRMVGDRVVAEGAPKVPEWATLGPDGNMSVNPLYLDMKKQIAAAGRASNDVKVFNNTKDDFKNERDLRNDFAGLPTTKAFNEVQSAHDQIQTALKTPSPASDLAAATKIMKILDPGSVVRESELGMAMSATGALDRIQNYAGMVMSGQKLTPAQRKDFGELSNKLYSAAADRYDASAKEYQSVAQDYGLNPGRVAKPSARNNQQSAIAPGGWSATVVK